MTQQLAGLVERLNTIQPVPVKGRVRSVVGPVVYARLPDVFVGELCLITQPRSASIVRAEVVGFQDGDALLMPLGEMAGVGTHSVVESTGSTLTVQVGDELRGRVLNAFGEALVGPPLKCRECWPVYRPASPAITRRRIREPFPIGIAAIDGLLPCGEGQRIGIFSGAGVGKSTLLGMIARNARADLNVVILIGERGREVVEFLEDNLRDSLLNSVLVYATSEESALVRMKAAYTGTTIAEYFRERGCKVLLLMDSVTRFARAQREVGLARGELPARGGFPPSFFAELPRLFERVGNSSHATGSITAFYTVLVEGGDLREPVADEVKSLLDGHIVLSEDLAKRGHRPAIDVLTSISRVTGSLPIPANVRHAAARMKAQLDRFRKLEDAIAFGQYKPGMDLESDEAVRNKTRIDTDFLAQRPDQAYSIDETYRRLVELMETSPASSTKTR